MISKPTLSIGIDLDDLRYYRGIHALPPAPDTPIIFDVAVPRFLDLCQKVGIPGTFFTISEDMKWPAARSILTRAVTLGHEVASHSRSHHYDLSRRDPKEIFDEVAGSKEDLQDALGTPVVGFRGPGYNLSDALLRTLKDANFQYDASILPSPAYWAARASIIGIMALTRRTSSSITGRMGDYFRSRQPFIWGEPAQGLKEFPITACGLGRLPLIGTTLTHRSPMRDHLLWSARGLPFVHLEFHAIDFLDIKQDGLEEDLNVEPALRIPLDVRLASYEHVLRTLAAGRQVSVLKAL